MIYAKNSQEPQAGQPFKEKFTYILNEGVTASKLRLNVRTGFNAETGALLNAPIILQTTESPQHIFDNQFFTEEFLEVGFWSLAFVTPITGWRIKVAEGYALPGLVDLRAYG